MPLLTSVASLAGLGLVPAGDFESIATVTVGSGGASSIQFTSIPGTYQHLQVRGIGRSDASTGFSWAYFTFNNDSGQNYATHWIRGDGSSASAASITGSVSLETRLGEFPRANATANIFGGLFVDILDYTNTSKNKTVRSFGGSDWNGSGRVAIHSSLWMDTSSITSIRITPQTNNWVQHSTFALYGIKA